MKSFVQSKTLWVNILGIVLVVLSATEFTALLPKEAIPYIGLAVMIITMILRSIKGQEDLVLKTPGAVRELKAAREAHNHEFWDRWWHSDETNPSRRGPQISRRGNSDALDRVIDDVRPGETVRIPVVEEEIIVERRPVPDEPRRDDYVVNRSADEPALRER